MTIPSVTLACTTGSCSSVTGSRQFVVYITNAGCTNPEFDARLSGAGSVSCAGGSCAGTVNSWVNSSGDAVTLIAASNWDFCAFIYFNGNPSSGTVISGDVRGQLEDVVVNGTAESLTQTMTNFTAVP